MNTYAKLCALPELSGPKVRYYSVHFDGNDKNEFEDFMLRHENNAQLSEHLDEMLAWVDDIAHNTGAIANFFRPEGRSSALPPKGLKRKKKEERLSMAKEPIAEEGSGADEKNAEGKKVSVNYEESNCLRLYLIRLNKNVVILLNGGQKTKNKAQQCPKVRPHFNKAQDIAKALDEALKSKDIKYNNSQTDITYSPDFEFTIS